MHAEGTAGGDGGNSHDGWAVATAGRVPRRDNERQERGQRGRAAPLLPFPLQHPRRRLLRRSLEFWRLRLPVAVSAT